MGGRFATFGLIVVLGVAAPPASGQGTAKEARARVRSILTVVDADGGSPRVVHEADGRFEAPNWSPDGSYLLINADGKLWRVAAAGGKPEAVATGAVTRINNDHGIAPDGKTFALSAGPIYVVPSAGGEPRRITEKTPSYFHGFAPDGKTLAYCAQRSGNFDLYAIAIDGGPERRLTAHPGYDDGPDYSPDGRWIYFNSDRSGSWDIWRIPAEGAGPDDAKAERITSDDREDWFPHPSPDGKWLVFVSFDRGTTGHPADRDVTIRRIPLPGAKVEPAEPRVIVRLFGGQGTLNVNSWSPDGKWFAFVRYEVAPAATKAIDR